MAALHVFVLLLVAGYVRPQKNACATTEICYDPITSRMKAEWSGINLHPQASGGIDPKGLRGLRGSKGDQGLSGPLGERGPPGPKGRPGQGLNKENIIRMVSEVLASMSPEPSGTEGGNISESAQARLKTLERKVQSLVAGRAVAGKPSVKPGGISEPTGEIDVHSWVNAANGYQYWISGNVNYNEAVLLCKDSGGTLATVGVRDPVIRKFLVEKLIKKRGVNVWIGLDDIKEEGKWMWQDGVRATTFNTDWATGQPDDYVQLEDCAVIQNRSGKMADGRCVYDQRALCER